MPETRSTSQRLQLAAINIFGAIIMGFVAWKVAAWGFSYLGAAAETYSEGSFRTRGSVRSGWMIPAATFLVAGFAALLTIGAIGNAAYLTFRRQD
jgi:hypothetical protein